MSHYAWSPDGKTLAVAYSAQNGTRLGGVSVAEVPDTATTPGIQGLRLLTPIEAQVDSEIYWYGDSEYVAFHYQANPPNAPREIGYSRYDVGFSKPEHYDSTYDPNVVVYPSVYGFFATPGDVSVPDFCGAGSTIVVPHGNVAISPSGAFTASTLEGVLRIFRAEDMSDLPDDVTIAESSGCSTLLTWGGRERSLCFDASASTLSLHTLNPTATPPTVERVVVANTGGYSAEQWSGSRRLISPSGNWAAMLTPANVYLADLRGSAPSVIRFGIATEWRRTFEPRLLP
ncbi:MAG: hypothetical protein QM784_31405 [Polyangiaceae bacterium]